MLSTAQPYLDVANIRYQFSPTKGESTDETLNNSFRYFNFSLSIPFILSKDSSMLVFSPFFDRWHIIIDQVSVGSVHSLAMPLTYIRPISHKWTAVLTAIMRWNSHESKFASQNLQAGGALLFTYKKQAKLSYKIGLYYNNEFFGPFLIPLVGLDWRIDERNNLFGVLPGNLTFEHKANSRLYFGATFRAITNSYKIKAVATSPPNAYIRVQDNQLGLFSDFYLAKNIVLNAELAHSVLRSFRMGYEDGDPKYYFSRNIKDNFVFKVSLAYRVRFSQNP